MSQQSSGEKTEKASPKKKRDARKKGEVHKSQDFVSAVSMVVVFSALRNGYSSFAESSGGFLKEHLSSDYVLTQSENLSTGRLTGAYLDTLQEVLPIVLPLMLIVMLTGVMLHVVQVGPMLSFQKIKPNFNKINPIQGFKRIFSTVTLMEMVKSIVKVAILGYIIFRAFLPQMDTFRNMMYLNVGAAFSMIIGWAADMGLRIGIALLIFAVVDIFYQWWKYEKDLKMTKQEVKEENKQTEGDPQIKGKIRQKQRRMSAMRMMQNVKTADVVVTNPTHFAVALRYDEKNDAAPVIVAKGQDFLAQRIKKLAKENNVTIVENKPVARALYAACEIGQTVPPDMYQAIADILIYVYKLTNKLPDDR